MSERLPYEEQLPQHLRDFPLPDENAAWADMKRRLDEDEDDGAVAWWRKGCALWAGLALLAALLISGWWFFNREKTDHATSTHAGNDTTVTNTPGTIRHDTLTNKSADGKPYQQPVIPIDSLAQTQADLSPDTVVSARKRAASLKEDQLQQTPATSQRNTGATEKPVFKKTTQAEDHGVITTKTKPQSARKSSQNKRETTAGNNQPVQPPKNIPIDSIRSFVAGNKPVQTRDTSTAITPDNLPLDSIRAYVAQDSSIRQQNDSILTSSQSWPIDSIKAYVTGDTIKHDANNPVALQTDSLSLRDSTVKKTDSTEKEYFLSAGLALTQQIPFAGQKAVPYGSQGREFSLADYIPSVYFRFNKKNRWFVQGEFRYGAPQYTKPFTYSIESDTSGTAAIVRSEKTLQKTYYHQLPISFNYYITRDWALGAGIVWNRFSKSVFEENQLQRNPLNPFDTFYVKETMVGKDPTREGLSRSYFHGLIESQYQWKKLSFGARYTFGLSPYLRFTLPGEAEQKERNQSLQFFIRYTLWAKSLKE